MKRVMQESQTFFVDSVGDGKFKEDMQFDCFSIVLNNEMEWHHIKHAMS